MFFSFQVSTKLSDVFSEEDIERLQTLDQNGEGLVKIKVSKSVVQNVHV